MKQCKFKEKYFDFEKNHSDTYHCIENSENDFCILHDKNSKNEKRIDAINKKIKHSIDSSESLFLIGCHLPDISIKGNFSRPVYFTKSKFSAINFSNSTFKEADFSGCIFEGKVDFSKTVFLLSDFMKSIFKDSVSFKNSKFPNGVNFSGSSFKESVDFSDTKLVGPIFIGVDFQIIDFSLSEIESGEYLQARIHKNANFIGAKIIKTTFAQAKFSGNTDFTGSEIKKSNFTDTQLEIANFSESSLEIIEFVRTSFKKLVTFERAQLKKIEFIQAKMDGNANFNEVRLEEVGFTKTKFLKKSNFTKSNFSLKANFKFCEFTTALFDEVKFRTNAQFNSSKFYELASFKETSFEETDFSNSEFGDHVLFYNSEFKGIIKFNNILFENPKHVLFDERDLSSLSFLNTDISIIRFGANVKWGQKNDFRLIDDKNITEKSETEIESLLAEYRSLRENYEKRFRDEDAQKILEHEIRLKQTLKKDQKDDLDLDIAKKLSDLTKRYHELKNEIQILEKKIENQ